jgi:SPX domain protein involved in polyphosphate accumulation
MLNKQRTHSLYMAHIGVDCNNMLIYIVADSVNSSLLSHFKEFLQLCEQLDDLRKFVVSNYVVVLKLLQKYDKLTHQQTREEFINRLAEEPFYSAKVLTNLLYRAESITDQLVTRKVLILSYLCFNHATHI